MPENVEDEDLFGENEAEETIDFGEEASVIRYCQPSGRSMFISSLLCSAADFTGDSEDQRLARSLKQDELDEKFGFARYKINDLRTGYLVNMQSVRGFLNTCRAVLWQFRLLGRGAERGNKKTDGSR